MQSGDDFPFFLALLNGYEIIAILAIMLVLLGSRRFPDLRRGFGDGFFHFRKSLDQQAEEAGRAVGFNYSKPAFDALTHDNQAIEFHDQRELGRVYFSRWKRIGNRFIRLLQQIRSLLRNILRLR